MKRQLPLIAAVLLVAPALSIAQEGPPKAGPESVVFAAEAPTTGWNSITENSVSDLSTAPFGITLGSDGAIWFVQTTSPTGGGEIGRIATNGAVTEYTPSSGCCIFPSAITAGPDGALWFTDTENGGQIGRLTTSGAMTEFPILSQSECCANPQDITTGPDGALWFVDDNYSSGFQIGRITTAGVVTEFPAAVVDPYSLTSGMDGALWFTEPTNNRIGRMTTAGVFTEYPLSGFGQPQSIVSGPDGNLWFTEFSSGKIGRITVAGVLTEFALPNSSSQPDGIAVGPDKAIWFTEYAGNKIGRITADGSITEYSIPTTTSSPAGIAPGSDGGLWFTQANGAYTANAIGRAWACGLDMNLAFANSTLDISFELGVATPASFSAALVSIDGIKQLWSRGIPAIAPPTPLTVPWGPGFPALGNVAVLSTLGVANAGVICWEWQTIGTGGSGASVDELRHMISASGLLPEAASK